MPKLLAEIRPTVKLIFICSPNNPTGNCFDIGTIESILDNFPGLVVIDEAYIDLILVESWLPRLHDYENLVVLQTLSKAWGLASIRLGIVFASSPLIEILNKIKYPYNVSGPCQQIALKALEKIELKEQMVKVLKEQREYLAVQLKKLAVVERVYPSETNFILVKMRSAQKVYNYLLKHKIVVRDRSREKHCNNCLRITVGTEEENQKIVKILKNI